MFGKKHFFARGAKLARIFEAEVIIDEAAPTVRLIRLTICFLGRRFLAALP